MDAGTLLGEHYRIECAIGQGGMGTVYRGRDIRLQRPVAIKLLGNAHSEQPSRARFLQEARTLARLNHPNIVQVYDFVEGRRPALIMEYVPGAQLGRQLKERPAPYPLRLQWLCEVADGLACAHQQGVLHRDLKPENILIDARGAAKLTDFGIARLASHAAEPGHPVTGTYAAMSPEQALGQPMDHRSDLFSLGVLCYRVAFAVHPFGNPGAPLELVHNIVRDRGALSAGRPAPLPGPLTELMHRLMAGAPERRPQCTESVAKTLRAIYEQERSGACWEPSASIAEAAPAYTAALSGPLPPPRTRS